MKVKFRTKSRGWQKEKTDEKRKFLYCTNYQHNNKGKFSLCLFILLMTYHSNASMHRQALSPAEKERRFLC